MTTMTHLTAAAAEVIPRVGSADWFSEFTRSPGLAGVLAVIAAAIALRGVAMTTKSTRETTREQLKAARQLAAKTRQEAIRDAMAQRERELYDQRAQRWWQMYEYALNVLTPKNQTVPRSLSADEDLRARLLLGALRASARTSFEKQMVATALRMLLTATEGPTGGV